jgi:hypothetical protein
LRARAVIATSQNWSREKPAIHRYFRAALIFARAIANAKIFRCVASPLIAARCGGARGTRDLHTKLSGVTVIFLLL